MRIANLTHGALLHARRLPRRERCSRSCRTCGSRRCSAGWRSRCSAACSSGSSCGSWPATRWARCWSRSGFAFIIADLCLVVWGGDPIPVPTPAFLQQPLVRRWASRSRATGSRWSVIAIVAAIALYLLMERTRLGAMIRAGVDDMQMARAVGIPVSRLFTIVFCLGAALAGAGGVIGGPILSAYPGLDADMLPLALIVVILGGVGSLLGAFVGSFIIGFVYTFGIALLPDLAYVILFLPMILVIAFRPQRPVRAVRGMKHGTRAGGAGARAR